MRLEPQLKQLIDLLVSVDEPGFKWYVYKRNKHHRLTYDWPRRHNTNDSTSRWYALDDEIVSLIPRHPEQGDDSWPILPIDWAEHLSRLKQLLEP